MSRARISLSVKTMLAATPAGWWPCLRWRWFWSFWPCLFRCSERKCRKAWWLEVWLAVSCLLPASGCSNFGAAGWWPKGWEGGVAREHKRSRRAPVAERRRRDGFGQWCPAPPVYVMDEEMQINAFAAGLRPETQCWASPKGACAIAPRRIARRRGP